MQSVGLGVGIECQHCWKVRPSVPGPNPIQGRLSWHCLRRPLVVQPVATMMSRQTSNGIDLKRKATHLSEVISLFTQHHHLLLCFINFILQVFALRNQLIQFMETGMRELTADWDHLMDMGEFEKEGRLVDVEGHMFGWRAWKPA
jgi:hypothetical protein